MKATLLVSLLMLVAAWAFSPEGIRGSLEPSFVDAATFDAPAPAPAPAEPPITLDPFVPTRIAHNNSISYPNGTNFAIGSTEGRAALNITMCNGVTCENGGTCNHGKCQCTAGFSGSRCEIDLCTGIACPLGHRCELGNCVLDLCYRVFCRNDGACDKGHCTCVNGFSGSLCEVNPCSQLTCNNGGICKLPGKCHCLNGFSGETCDTDACTNVKCENGGKCLYGNCICPPEYDGPSCTIKTEALKDQEMYTANVSALETQVERMADALERVRQNSDPELVTTAFREKFREHADRDMAEAEEKAKADWMKPQVRGLVPIRRPDLRMPNTPYENAKIYEDQALAYHLGHETRSRRLVGALKLINVTDENIKYRKEVLAKDVPGAEHFTAPFGRFAQIHDKYAPNVALLESDIVQHREQKEALASSILAADDLLA